MRTAGECCSEHSYYGLILLKEMKEMVVQKKLENIGVEAIINAFFSSDGERSHPLDGIDDYMHIKSDFQLFLNGATWAFKKIVG